MITSDKIDCMVNIHNIHHWLKVEYNIGNGQLSDVTGSAHLMGRYLANAIVSDKSKWRK